MSNEPPTRPPSLAQKLAAVIRYRPGPAGRRLLLAVGAVVMLGGLVLALRQHPLSLDDLSWPPLLVIAFVAVPAMVLFSAGAFQLTAIAAGVRCSLRRAAEVSIIGTAANLLPVPGGTVTRIAALKLFGATYARAGAATVAVAFVWMGLYLAIAGLSIAWVGSGLVGAAFIAAGVSLTALALFWITRMAGLAIAGKVLVLQLGLFVADVARVYLCLRALGSDGGVPQAAALTASAVAGSAVALMPAGLGIREAAAAALGPLVGIEPAIGFLVAGLNRVLALGVLAPIGAVLAARRERADRTAPE